MYIYICTHILHISYIYTYNTVHINMQTIHFPWTCWVFPFFARLLPALAPLAACQSTSVKHQRLKVSKGHHGKILGKLWEHVVETSMASMETSDINKSTVLHRGWWTWRWWMALWKWSSRSPANPCLILQHGYWKGRWEDHIYHWGNGNERLFWGNHLSDYLYIHIYMYIAI